MRLQLSIHHTRSTRTLINHQRLRRVTRHALQVAQQRGRFALSLAFVGDRTMRRLNYEYAGNDYPTDVLSFAAREDSGHFFEAPATQVFLGEIVIALPQAIRQARLAEHSLAREVELLLTHGVLHLLGYDHAATRDAQQMRALEQQILLKS